MTTIAILPESAGPEGTIYCVIGGGAEPVWQNAGPVLYAAHLLSSRRPKQER